MFKKKQNELTTSNVYTVFDKISKTHVGLFYAINDETMIRTSLPSILMDYSFRDIYIRKIGKFDSSTGTIISITPVNIPLDSYTFPHSRLSSKGDDLTLEEIDTAMKDKKSTAQKKIQDLKDAEMEKLNKKEA